MMPQSQYLAYDQNLSMVIAKTLAGPPASSCEAGQIELNAIINTYCHSQADKTDIIERNVVKDQENERI